MTTNDLHIVPPPVGENPTADAYRAACEALARNKEWLRAELKQVTEQRDAARTVVEELTAELEDRCVRLRDTDNELAKVRAALTEANRKRTVAEAAHEALARDNTAYRAENARLREQVFAQKPVIEAAHAWAEMVEIGGDAPGDTRKIEDALHDAIEQHRLMELALTTAHSEAAEQDKCRDIYPGRPIIGGAPLCHRGCGIPVWRHAAASNEAEVAR